MIVSFRELVPRQRPPHREQWRDRHRRRADVQRRGGQAHREGQEDQGDGEDDLHHPRAPGPLLRPPAAEGGLPGGAARGPVGDGGGRGPGGSGHAQVLPRGLSWTSRPTSTSRSSRPVVAPPRVVPSPRVPASPRALASPKARSSLTPKKHGDPLEKRVSVREASRFFRALLLFAREEALLEALAVADQVLLPLGVLPERRVHRKRDDAHDERVERRVERGGVVS